MVLKGGTNSSNSTIYTDDDSTTQNKIKVGDTIKISGTASNNGVFTVTDITTDGTSLGSNGDVYYSLKGVQLTNESSADSTDPLIEVVRAPGDKLIALGDVDSAGGIDVWSNNATTDYVGVSPASANGWTESAITPTSDGNDAKYIYYFADEALRVCNINESNTSTIRWYGYIQRQQFSNNLGLSFSEWQEHPNTLAPPRLAQGSFTHCYGTSSHSNSTATNFYQNNRGVARQKEFTDGSALRFRADTGHFANMLGATQKAFLLDALNDDDSVLDFGGNTSDGDGVLLDVATKGFVSASSSATFIINSGSGRLTNTGSARGEVYLRIITVSGTKYQVSFDVGSGSNANARVSLSTDTSHNSSAQSASISSGGATNNSLQNSFTAEASTSYLILQVDSTTNTEYCDFDNITVYIEDELAMENTSSVAVLDQNILGEVITIGEALGTYPKEALICTQVSGGGGGPITYKRKYGGALVGTAPHVINNADTPIVERGLGFNIGVSEVDSGSTGAPDGSWEAGTYEFYQTFLYDGNQESLPLQMGGGQATTSLAAFEVTATGDKSLIVSVYADVFYSGRISGARVYTRLKNTDDDLILFADIDIVKGVRLTIDGTHVPWSYESADGYYVLDSVSERPNLDTYNTINGYPPDIHFNAIGGRNEVYKASVVANRRAFIANLKVKGANIELQKYGDRIMYSEINRFDTFLEYNFIDVSKGDFGEYVALESYADRLLAFKHNLIHVINIASPSPANWFLEDTIKHFGANYNFSVTKTANGIAWLTDNGCYLYDGNVNNLLDRKIAVSSASYSGTDVNWQDWYRGTSNVKDVSLGYEPISNSLLMFRSPDDSSDYSNTGWIYDFDTNGWAYHTSIFTDSENYTNFIIDWNNNLTVGWQDSNTIHFYKYLPISKSLQNQEFVTRDIDFAVPGLVKKIYKVIVTYKSDASVTTPFSYAIDGKQNFSGDGGGTFTGNFSDTSSKWDVVTLTPSSTISCQSIQIKFANGSSAGKFEINDITIQYRAIRDKEAT